MHIQGKHVQIILEINIFALQYQLIKFQNAYLLQIWEF